jgi:ubiquinone/menaquinone biosynthesis C-methylase UbiE
MADRVDYDKIAPSYDARYAGGLYSDALRTLRNLIIAKKPRSALDVGCGTGYWLSALRDLVPRIYGLDYSREMLRKASAANPGSNLIRGTAETLPFRDAVFDLIYCVNALHHFGQIDACIGAGRRLLAPGGTLVIIGMDPHHGRDRWCVYDYFPETRAIDLDRYPSSGQIADAMLWAGFDRIESSIACRFEATRLGSAVFDDPELRRNGCSQLALLTDEQYAAGIARIQSAIEHPGPNAPAVFKVNIALMMHCGSIARPTGT